MPFQTTNTTTADTKQPAREELTSLDWLDSNKESILLFGPPKHGKTYAYCSYIEDTIKKGNRVFVISTDGGLPRTLKRYLKNANIEDPKKFLKDKIYYKQVTTVDAARSFWTHYQKEIKPNDLFVVDLISRFYEWLQADFVDFISRGNITQYIMNAMNDPRKFGLLEGSKWNYIKAAHRFIEDIVDRRLCNVVCVATEKDTEGEKGIGGAKAEAKLKKVYLQNMSVRASGQKDLPSLFDTLVRVSMQGSNKYACMIIGDRGYNPSDEVIIIGQDFREVINQFREKQD